MLSCPDDLQPYVHDDFDSFLAPEMAENELFRGAYLFVLFWSLLDS
jgi:hypothetical protein